ncbi:hypothetical protein AK812_SmicGene29135 [Symbiodinium microadriaticum]|uniref:Uncharacterized protein n=1 Tax=Symbiodinium microadriaticum TaxID=2951 RepID=A0A1Q9D2N0_SYMMI|nr:hypothetical protein AK812_SmicGene29135 [Symbiodinium microadriaticum]
MRLREAVVRFAAPKDTFVSMRIGFDTAKTYKFPKLEDASGLARIEVFQRVGHQTVSLGKLHHSEQSVEVPVNMPGMSFLPMRLGLHTGQAVASEVNTEPKIKKDTKVKTKLDAAQKCNDTSKAVMAANKMPLTSLQCIQDIENMICFCRYLAEHQLEEVIADAMREVIHEKPAERIDGQKEQPPAPPVELATLQKPFSKMVQ